MSNLDLLPCPFCGGAARVVKWKQHGRSHYTANCTVCDATATDEVYEDNAALKWNRRFATAPAPRGGVTEASGISHWWLAELSQYGYASNLLDGPHNDAAGVQKAYDIFGHLALFNGRTFCCVRAVQYEIGATPPAAQAQDAGPKVEYRLFDSQWVSVVNHSHGYLGFSIENAVRKAAELTEKFMRANIEEGKFPRARAIAAKEAK